MSKLWTIIIVGATGDLSKRKLLPALYALLKRQSIDFRVVAIAREVKTVAEIVDQARSFIVDYDSVIFNELVSRTTYCSVDVTVAQDFKKLALVLDQLPYGSPNRLVYCAVDSQLFCPLTLNLQDSGVLVRGNATHRIIYEKPFGSDSVTAQIINQCIEGILEPSQIYRIDHYLAKEFVSNIVIMRCSNALFSSVWDNQHIACVRVIMHEKICLEGRGKFYDHYGALKDVVQNHLLQLFTLVALECPGRLSQVSLTREKSAILQAVQVKQCIVGQYEGYRQEPGVNPNSLTETFAFVELALDTPRWYGVPFYIETGKCLASKRVEIQVIFKGVRPCAFQSGISCSGNILTIRLGPREGFSLILNSKVPNKVWQAMPVIMDFCHDCLYDLDTPQAYERVLCEVISGERSIAVSAEEIEAQWKIIEKAIQQKSILYSYSKGSAGPQEVQELLLCEGYEP